MIISIFFLHKSQKELAYIRQQMGSLVAVAGPLFNNTRAKVASKFGNELYAVDVVESLTFT